MAWLVCRSGLPVSKKLANHPIKRAARAALFVSACPLRPLAVRVEQERLATQRPVTLPVSVVHRFARFFQFGHFVRCQHLSEFAFGAFTDCFHLRVRGFAGGGVTALAFHRLLHGAALRLRFDHDGCDLSCARGVEV